MAHPKKKHPHFCRNHPKAVAVGRCVSCRTWICRECAKPGTGPLSCRTECAGRVPDTDVLKTVEPSPVSPRISVPFPGLMLLAAITLGLCGVVFGLWEVRQYRIMKADVEALKEKRIELIDHIKDANREIAFLRSELDSLRRNPITDATTGSKKIFFTAEPLAPPAHLVEGLPLSFDNGNVGEKIVALTFDGSSLSNAVNEILDTLQSRNIKATVFMTGDFMRAFPDAVKRIAADGHETGNHTFSHPHMTTWAQDRTHTTLPSMNASFLCQELARTDSVYFSLTGKHLSRIWRAPYGEKNRTICSWAQQCGYLHVGWRQGKGWRQCLDSNDWIPDEETPGFHSPEEVLDKIIALAQEPPNGVNGGIILMHLGTVRKDAKAQVHRILGKLIDDLKGLGYGFVTVSEMLKESGVPMELLEGKSLTRN
jgi:peptidoglycan/xylan/chitin deacetylase (PgdA/CDA1 family)